MIISPLFIFSASILIFYFLNKFLSPYYSLDNPGKRKKHVLPTSQIGGLIFNSLFLLIGKYYDLFPNWFLLGGCISIILGVMDDNYDMRWYVKFIIQLLILCFLAYLFWGKFNELEFYNYSFEINQVLLLFIFSIWFIGIYNAVNLMDGIDGLAASFMTLYCLSLTFIGKTEFLDIGILLASLLLVFLVFNQRPAVVFMGDSGSLFLGYFVAVSPLLFYNLTSVNPTSLNMTPFIILVSYLVADTTRVFFTRLLSGKSPMTADTIHFHHLIIENSGSYLVTLFIILFTTFISSVFAILSSIKNFSEIGLLIHLSFIFLFILTPPVPTYVKFISKIVKPVYVWSKRSNKNNKLSSTRTLILFIFLFFLLIPLLFNLDFTNIDFLQTTASILCLLIFLFLNNKPSIVIASIQLFTILFVFENTYGMETSIIVKLTAIFSLIALFVFAIQKRYGVIIKDYSTLDILIVLISLGAIIVSLFGINLNIWFFIINLSLWFNLGFLLRRTIYKPSTN